MTTVLYTYMMLEFITPITTDPYGSFLRHGYHRVPQIRPLTSPDVSGVAAVRGALRDKWLVAMVPRVGVTPAQAPKTIAT